MALIASISGIRGTIGGRAGENLTPVDVVKFTAAFARLLKQHRLGDSIVIGRDGRISGKMISDIVSATLTACGYHVIDLGLSTTPTVEMAVPALQAAGGIIITASHNPVEWNALKLLNNKGEFISAEMGSALLDLIANDQITFAGIDQLGDYRFDDGFLDYHIDKIIDLPLVDTSAIHSAGFHVVVDGINSSGGIAVPKLLERLGVGAITRINCTPDGNFAHNPEPLPEHLTALAGKVRETGAGLGIAVDPDVDRLALVCENGQMFGEEYTLVAVADYVLQHTPGPAVSNLSSSRALRDVAESHGCPYYAAAVGEVNVVSKMKEVNAVIGGEGNGGIIYPQLHYGRDALVGIALFLSYLAKSGKTASQLKSLYPQYHMMKKKLPLDKEASPEKLLQHLQKQFASGQINTEDGLKIDFKEGWVHLRVSNTEPVMRLYVEGVDNKTARKLLTDVETAIMEYNKR